MTSPQISPCQTAEFARIFALDNVAGELSGIISILILLIFLGFLLIYHIGTSLGVIAPGSIARIFVIMPLQKRSIHHTCPKKMVHSYIVVADN